MTTHSIGLKIATISLGLTFTWAVSAQETPVEDSTQQTVVVTGSRIPTVTTEGPSPVTVITKEDIQRRGFTTVLDAASALTQISGISQNEIDTNGFTPNAGVINLRALGPGRTLILLDGRRITDYPLPYNSESNFVNLSAIPAASVERIELLAGGASAIYGSDAVAGVLNIVLRKHINTPLDVNVRFGDTSQGAGASRRIQGVGGWSTDNFDLVYSAEYFHRDPIFGLDRSFMDSVADNPDQSSLGAVNPRSLLLSDPIDIDGDGLQYIDPGAAACTPFQNMVYSTRPGRGNYCGQPNDPAQASIRNKTDRESLYTRAAWRLGDQEVYGALNYFQSVAKLDPNFSWWTFIDSPGFVFNTRSDPFGIGGMYQVMQRFFQPAEIGGREGRENRFDERVIDAAVGIKGNLWSTNWKYDASFSRSSYKVKSRERSLLAAEVDNYFLGPQIGVDPNFGFVPTFDFDIAKFYQPLTPAIWNQLTGVNQEDAHSSNNVGQVVLNGDLFKLPAGPLAMAAVIEYGRQSYKVDPDPRLVRGEFWGFTGTGGGGERKRAAVGVEFRAPIFSTLDAQLAGRYDNYDDITSVNDAISYNFGLEYRPIRQLLLRGSLATSFRAPDMHYIFADPSGFFSQVTDEFLCRRDEPNVSLADCTNSAVGISGTRSGNPTLEEENGRSYTVGFVAEPFKGASIKVDYYHIKLSGAVLDNPLARILEIEADCRLGQTKGGQPVDINSGKCQDAISRIVREPVNNPQSPEALDSISTGPINTADIRTSGIDAEASYLWRTGAAGSFNFGLGWSHTLKYDEQDFSGDPLENRRDDLQIFDWRSRVNATVTWDFGAFTTTAYGERYGSLPNWAETGRIGSLTLMNLSSSYRFANDRAEASIIVDNVFDTNPPRDRTYDQYPYFSSENYSPIGREWFLQLRYSFGGGIAGIREQE